MELPLDLFACRFFFCLGFRRRKNGNKGSAQGLTLPFGEAGMSQGTGSLMEGIASNIGNAGMLTGEEVTRLLSILAAFFPARETTLRPNEFLLMGTQCFGIGNRWASIGTDRHRL